MKSSIETSSRKQTRVSHLWGNHNTDGDAQSEVGVVASPYSLFSYWTSIDSHGFGYTIIEVVIDGHLVTWSMYKFMSRAAITRQVGKLCREYFGRDVQSKAKGGRAKGSKWYQIGVQIANDAISSQAEEQSRPKNPYRQSK